MIARRAYSTVELLLVMAVLIIASLTMAHILTRASLVTHEARTVSHRLTIARASAVVSGESTTCIGPRELGSLARTVPSRGLRFTPDGLPRTCDGGGVGNTTILLEHRGRQAAVIVSSLGRVRWELR